MRPLQLKVTQDFNKIPQPKTGQRYEIFGNTIRNPFLATISSVALSTT